MEKTAGRQTLSALRRSEADALADHLTAVYDAYGESRYGRVRHNMIEVAMPLRVRLSVMTSQDRIERLTRKVLTMNELVRDKYLRTLFDCMEEETKKTLMDAILGSTVGNGRYETQPELHDTDYRASDDVVRDLTEQLGEGETLVRRNAYLRLKLYYQHTDNEAHRTMIADSVRVWRDEGEMDVWKLESLNVVPFDAEKETCDPETMAHQRVETFCGSQHTLERNSVGIENLRNEIEAQGILLDYTTATDKERTVTGILDAMEQNRDVLKQDDGKELMGGLRHFTQQLMLTVEQYLVHVLPSCCEETARRARPLLEDYSGYGFRLMPALTCCLQRLGDEEALRMLAVRLGEQMMEEDGGAATDAIAALTMLERTQLPEGLMDTVSGYIRYARRYHSRYLLQYLWVLVVKDKATESDYHCCLKVLKDVGHLVGSYDTDADQSSDIIYDAFRLAGAIYARHEELREDAALQAWKALAENDEVFNDQRMGWREGERR